MTNDELKTLDLQRVAIEGKIIYEAIKGSHEPQNTGKFLAIDIDSKDVYLSDSSAEAVAQARNAHPNKVFYVVKVGYDAAETMSNLLSFSHK